MVQNWYGVMWVEAIYPLALNNNICLKVVDSKWVIPWMSTGFGEKANDVALLATGSVFRCRCHPLC